MSLHRGARVSALGVLLVAAMLVHAAPASPGAVTPPSSRFRFDEAPGLLSKQVVPRHYALTLDVDPGRDTFSGQVAIDLRIARPVDGIELHAFELSARQARLVVRGAGRALRVMPQPDTQTWRLEPTDGGTVPAGEARLEIEYDGKVHVAGEGLFVVPYEVGGQPQHMLATQLQPISARKLFPSFDEPAFRAVFEIAVRVPTSVEALSNMPQRERLADGSGTLYRFAPTPPMPSYLVSVAVGRFAVLAGRAGDVPLRILTPPGKQPLARYALRTTQQLVPYFEQYFGTPYSLPKLDQLAVPGVRWGAMEDWGLISYTEGLLLVDPERSSPREIRGVFSIVAHELSHQWFGNLVTAASWEEIWLNEAFATWMADKVADRFNPSWQVHMRNRVSIDGAMVTDAGSATRPIRSGPVRESAVWDVFDEITYVKGGAVLTMLEQWIGHDAFQRGLASYMKQHRLSNATAADLWHHVGLAAGRDVRAVAASWTDQPGFPLVEVAVACADGRHRMTLAQSRFGYGSAVAGSEARWRIPLRYTVAGKAATLLFDGARHEVDLGPCSDAQVTVNAGGLGFYRVAYAQNARQGMVARYDQLPAADRLSLLSDSFALMQVGRLPIGGYMDVLRALPRVTDKSRTLLWSTAQQQLRFLDQALAGTAAQQALREAGRQLLTPVLADLTWHARPGEDEQTGELRGTLVELLASFEHQPTIKQARQAYAEDEAGRSPLPPALRRPVTMVVGMHADREQLQQLLARLRASDFEPDRWMFAAALASCRDPELVADVLGVSLAGLVQSNIAAALPSMVAYRSPFGAQAYDFTLEHWDDLSRLAGVVGRPHLLPGASSGFNDAEHVDRLLADQRRLVGADGNTLAARAAASIRLRAAVQAREASRLMKEAAAD